MEMPRKWSLCPTRTAAACPSYELLMIKLRSLATCCSWRATFSHTHTHTQWRIKGGGWGVHRVPWNPSFYNQSVYSYTNEVFSSLWCVTEPFAHTAHLSHLKSPCMLLGRRGSRSAHFCSTIAHTQEKLGALIPRGI